MYSLVHCVSMFSTVVLKGKPRDPGIPNNLPFKEEILKEAVAYKVKVSLSLLLVV